MSDDLVKRLRRADEYEPLGHDAWEAADTIERLTRERDACVREVSNLGRQIGTAEAERDKLRRDRLRARETRRE